MRNGKINYKTWNFATYKNLCNPSKNSIRRENRASYCHTRRQRFRRRESSIRMTITRRMRRFGGRYWKPLHTVYIKIKLDPSYCSDGIPRTNTSGLTRKASRSSIRLTTAMYDVCRNYKMICSKCDTVIYKKTCNGRRWNVYKR